MSSEKQKHSDWNKGPFVNYEKYLKVKQRIQEKFTQHDNQFISISRQLIWYTRFLIIFGILILIILGITLYSILN